MNKWILHDLSDANKEHRIEISHLLLSTDNGDYLDRVYDNRRCFAHWLDEDEAPKHNAETDNTPGKVMVRVWWTAREVVHYNFFPPCHTIASEFYCAKLMSLISIAIKNHDVL